MPTEWFERVSLNTTIDPVTGCWLFNGSRTHNGYGQIWFDGRIRRVHRVSYSNFVGDIPVGMLVCHSCDVRNCWNPEHLFCGTDSDNVADMMRKGRHRSSLPEKMPDPPKGEEHPRAKLGEAEVLSIRRAALQGATKQDLATTFGVNESNIRKIVNRETWRHLPPETEHEPSAEKTYPQSELRRRRSAQKDNRRRQHPNQDHERRQSI